METLYFVTTNTFKAEEIKKLFESNNKVKFEIIDKIQITEIMDLELEVIVKDKLLKAYQGLGLPCVVEHGALHIEYLNRLPGGISKVVWDNLGEKICKLLPNEKSQRKAVAKSVVGYCDGVKMHLFNGETEGYITQVGTGARKFQWDPIFVPDGETKTYAELSIEEKMGHSQAIKAWNQLIEFLNNK